jgi:Bacterial type II and III secretion system protein
MVVLAAGLPGLSVAQSGKQVRVSFDFRQSSTQNRDAVDAGGRVIITDRGTRSSGSVGVDSTQRRVRSSTGIFTIVQDGGESTMLVASQVPYPQVTFYRDYLTGAGYVATSVQFRDVGTSLKVRAAILPGNQVRVRLTPTVSWFSADGSGVIEVNEASTELVVPSGRPVVLGGATTQTHELTRRILGYRASESSTETTMALTATIR